MPIIPMNQTVTIHRPGGKDDWGRKIPGETIVLHCRAEETTEVITNQYGEEATATLKLYFDKLADIRYDDTIEYVNELGVAVSRKPQRIEVKRWLSSQPALTVVYV